MHPPISSYRLPSSGIASRSLIVALDAMSAIEKQYSVGPVKKRAGQATAILDAPPDRVFAALLSTGAPGGSAEGAEWTVTRQVMGRRFTSRGHVIELDHTERRFAYRSKLEGDNP